MAKLAVRKITETYLELHDPESGLYPKNHIYEPEFHQEDYVSVCKDLGNTPGAFQLSNCMELVSQIHRGVQPQYADLETDPSSLYWYGMTDSLGNLISDENANICALKSVCVRAGYVDLETARSVSKETYEKTRARAGIQKTMC